MEAGLLERAGIPFAPIPAAGVHGVGLRALPQNLWRLGHGTRSAARILKQFQPDILFFTGGYVAIPVALAGRHVPTLLYVPDIEPGLALRFAARFSDRIAVTAEESRAYFFRRTEVVVTGYPIRPDLRGWDRRKARAHLRLDPQLPVLLVFGGSQGARSINRALFADLSQFLQNFQVVHISGQLSWSEAQAAQASLPQHLASRYHPYAYLHEDMGAALASADLAVSRAGASVLGELPFFGLPAILVPYPHAWHYQRVNAEYLVRHGAAVILDDNRLPDHLFSLAQGLINDETRLKAMRRALQNLAQPNAAEAIAAHLRQLTQKNTRVSGGRAWSV